MSNRRSALDKGLGALISGAGGASAPASTPGSLSTREPAAAKTLTADTAPDTPGVQTGAPAMLSVADIEPNPEQPRRHFDPKHLEELASSIKLHGVLQPIVVRRGTESNRYELIVGERRWRATKQAGFETIPAVIADIETRDRLELAIIENVQRHDLNPVELAHAYRALADTGTTQEEIGQRVSKDRSSIANHLRLLELSRDLQEDLEEGRLSMGHAKALLQVSNPERRRHLRNRILSERLSVRDAEQLGREIAGPVKRTAPRKPRKAPALLDPSLEPVLQDLQRHLQTRVRIVGGTERGKIEIEYFDKEDLERLVALLVGS